MKGLLIIPFVALASLALTYGLRKYALAKSLMDIPNERSSHSVPTPRGGGVAIVISFFVGLLFVSESRGIGWNLSIALFGAGGFVALVGFLDDLGHIAARWRLLAHFAAAFWALAWLGGVPAVEAFGIRIDLGWLGVFLGAVYLVWVLNLYNFMDGIDGIASVEAICVCLGGSFLYVVIGKSEFSFLPLILAASVVGFLYWNFPPARIFMGDAGSGFLGISLGIMSLQAAMVTPELFCCWVILLGVFVVDATFTLIRRLFRGEKIYKAHRSHAYQYASRKYGRHLPVTLTVGVINLMWLLPVAVLVALNKIGGMAGLLIAYTPLVSAAFRFKAGELEVRQER